MLSSHLSSSVYLLSHGIVLSSHLSGVWYLPVTMNCVIFSPQWFVVSVHYRGLFYLLTLVVCGIYRSQEIYQVNVSWYLPSEVCLRRGCVDLLPDMFIARIFQFAQQNGVAVFNRGCLRQAGNLPYIQSFAVVLFLLETTTNCYHFSTFTILCTLFLQNFLVLSSYIYIYIYIIFYICVSFFYNQKCLFLQTPVKIGPSNDSPG